MEKIYIRIFIYPHHLSICQVYCLFPSSMLDKRESDIPTKEEPKKKTRKVDIHIGESGKEGVSVQAME